MEALKGTQEDGGLLSNFLVGLRSNEKLVVLHLSFTNETLIVCEANAC